MRGCDLREKYFFGEKYSGEDLLKLGFIDMMATIHEGGKPDLENFDLMVGRIEELKKLGKDKRLPKPLLNGHEVMKILSIGPGEKVGQVLTEIREKQLEGKVRTREEAIKEIKRLRN